MKKLALAAAAAVIGVGAAHAQNIVANPGFQTTGAAWYGFGWSDDADGFDILGDPDGVPFSGDQAAETGCVGHECVSTYNEGAFMGQWLSTVANQSYTLSFWEAEIGTSDSEFSLFWNGQLVTSVLNPNNNADVPYPPFHSPWRQYVFTGLIATGTSTDLQIHGRDDPGAILFDNVSVEANVSPVPEPATWTAMIGGFGLIGGAMRRRRSDRMRVTAL